MKKLLQNICFLFLVIFSGNLIAQVTHTITVGSNSFSPSNITINANDTVLFQLIAGSHTILSTNGSWTEITTFPAKLHGLAPGSYTFVCGNNRSMTGTITVHSGSSPSANSQRYELIVSPNPFEDEVTLTINKGNKALTSVRIFDLIGKEVAHIDLKNKPGLISYKLDFSRLNPGVYFCNVYSESGLVETKKLFRTK